MSQPLLRQPKLTGVIKKRSLNKPDFVILTLRNGAKLVISSDAYHGIMTIENVFQCVFCKTTMELNCNQKESHKNSSKHLALMSMSPFSGTYKEHLVKQLNDEQYYCMICNVIVTSPFIKRHVEFEVHTQELEMAAARAASYKPHD